MTTIAKNNPDSVLRIEKAGFPHVAEMMRRHKTFADLDRELGYYGASKNWVNGRNTPSPTAEKLAKMLIETGGKTPARTEPSASSDLVMLLVPADQMEKLRRVSGILGCEFIE